MVSERHGGLHYKVKKAGGQGGVNMVDAAHRRHRQHDIQCDLRWGRGGRLLLVCAKNGKKAKSNLCLEHLPALLPKP
jgi:hypothetical protein